MVKLLIGSKGSGKTKKLIDIANERVEKSDGSIVFINKNRRLTYDLKHDIRVVCMEEYEEITNIDEYVGFLYGIASSNHDIEVIFIDSILKHADIDVENMEEFLGRLELYSKKYEIELIVSISADKEMMGNVLAPYELLNDGVK